MKENCEQNQSVVNSRIKIIRRIAVQVSQQRDEIDEKHSLFRIELPCRVEFTVRELKFSGEFSISETEAEKHKQKRIYDRKQV